MQTDLSDKSVTERGLCESKQSFIKGSCCFPMGHLPPSSGHTMIFLWIVIHYPLHMVLKSLSIKVPVLLQPRADPQGARVSSFRNIVFEWRHRAQEGWGGLISRRTPKSMSTSFLLTRPRDASILSFPSSGNSAFSSILKATHYASIIESFFIFTKKCQL